VSDRTEGPKESHLAHDPDTGLRWYVGPSEEPTDEQRAEYERQVPEQG
jgi:hypothetical protein